MKWNISVYLYVCKELKNVSIRLCELLSLYELIWIYSFTQDILFQTVQDLVFALSGVKTLLFSLDHLNPTRILFTMIV